MSDLFRIGSNMTIKNIRNGVQPKVHSPYYLAILYLGSAIISTRQRSFRDMSSVSEFTFLRSNTTSISAIWCQLFPFRQINEPERMSFDQHVSSVIDSRLTTSLSILRSNITINILATFSLTWWNGTCPPYRISRSWKCKYTHFYIILYKSFRLHHVDEPAQTLTFIWTCPPYRTSRSTTSIHFWKANIKIDNFRHKLTNLMKCIVFSVSDFTFFKLFKT